MEHELWRAVQGLLIAGLVYLAYTFAAESARKNGPVRSALKGVIICAGIAVFAAGTLGQGTCLSGDPMFGGCDERADDGFVPSMDQRYGTALYWFVLLSVPVVMAAVKQRGRLRR